MLTRAGWEGSWPKQNAAMWQMWDAFGLSESEMMGWWSSGCPAHTIEPRVVATVYRRHGLRALVAVGSWLRREWRGELRVDWALLGMEPKRIHVRQLDSWGAVQRTLQADELRQLHVPARSGVLLLLEPRMK
mmetsp:Transcript_51077/g.134333  ORF Transcript_51077/g.134333 Transcript_51077/m.134333 type:complete len:132 (-) Transcript_51077:72-467(-)